MTNTGDVWLVPELRAKPPLPAPVLSRLKLAPAAFHAALRGASVARAATGTTISYSVSEASTTTFTVERASQGRNFIPLHGNFTHHGVPGTNRFHFTGRIGGRALFTLLPNALPPKPFGPDAVGLGPISFDINGDGHPDLLIGFTKNNPFYVGRWIQVLINMGDGTFSDQTSTYLPQSDNFGAWPMFFRLADLQRTGKLDFGLVTFGPSGDHPPLLYLRDQNGNFEPGPAITGGETTSCSSWSFIDATGDGSNDMSSDLHRQDETVGLGYHQRSHRDRDPGRYRLHATPKNATGHAGQTKQTPFRIVS